MNPVVVVIPSRGRPERAKTAIVAIRATAVRIDTSVVLAVDYDDPRYEDYAAITFPDYGVPVTLVTLQPEHTGNLVRATNTVALRIAEEDPTAIIGNLGDDHLTRTQGWDKAIADALTEPGIAYGDDLLQGEELPTAPFISARIVLALGYYFLPDLAHMYCDNQVRDIAVQAGVRHYLPDVVIEHVHPFAGKAEWDDGYRRVNAEEPVRDDRLHYESWRKHAMATDVARVRHALTVAA